MKKIVIALGGNALQKQKGKATSEEQLSIVRDTAKHIANIIERGYKVILSHGNGPQVGRLVLQNEASSHITPAMPFDVCGAMSQGMIGYHIQQALGDELRKRGIDISVATVVTQVLVDKEDDAFKNATKPIGPFYTEDEAEQIKREKGYTMKEDAGRGWRRVVASPQPKGILELNVIKTLLENDVLLIAGGGGGIPVAVKSDGNHEGVEAVIDKDLASEKLAEEIEAELLLILTEVEKVYIHYGSKNQKAIDNIQVSEALQYMDEGHFAPGSMLPKVKAAVKFAESGEGRQSIITSLEKAIEAIEGKTGTVIG